MNKFIKGFVKPRFRVEEFEKGVTVCGCGFEITVMKFDDGLCNYPISAMGNIKFPNATRTKARWNQCGECMVNGKREKQYDLIRPGHKAVEKDTNGIIPAMACGLGVILLIIYLLIWN